MSSRKHWLLLLFLSAAASSSSALRPDEVSMGTTILCVRYDGGVVVGADTRTSVSGYVSNRYAAKLTFVLDGAVDSFVGRRAAPSAAAEGALADDQSSGDGAEMTEIRPDEGRAVTPSTAAPPRTEAFSTCAICRSGSAADTQSLASTVRAELVRRRLQHGVPGTVTQAAAMLRNLLVGDSGLSASLVCAGYDHVLGRGCIFTIGPGGTVFEEESWAAGGSGSSFVLGHLDSRLSSGEGGGGPGILATEEEALDAVAEAIGLAMERDGSSGGFVRMYVVDKDGRRFVTRAPGHGGRSDGPASLRDFAPAIRSGIMITNE